MKCKCLFLGLIFPVVFVGCSHVSVLQLKPDLIAKGRYCPLEVVTSPESIQKPYETTCVISSTFGELEDGLEKAKKEACKKCDADGLLITGVVGSGDGVLTDFRHHMSYKAYRFKK